MNCKPGDLAEFLPGQINGGRRVSVIRAATGSDTLPGWPDVLLHKAAWVVLPLQPLIAVRGDERRLHASGGHVIVADSKLRPIRGLFEQQEDAIPASLPMLAPECERVV